MVPPAATRVMAEASVVGADWVPGALALPPGDTYSVVAGLPVGVGVGVGEGEVPVGEVDGVGDAVVLVGVGLVPPVVTITSSKLAVEKAVCTPMRPPPTRLLVAVATVLPLTEPLIWLPFTLKDRVYHVPVDTVRDALPSTETDPLLTACS